MLLCYHFTMAKKRSWTIEQLEDAVKHSTSIRQVIRKLGLRGAGSNYAQMHKYIEEFALNIDHFKGQAWNKGLQLVGKPRLTLDQILVNGSTFQSYKLKQRLIAASLKPSECELCGWAKITPDGRLPLELDHINGNRWDNRLENLRILCPNCHSHTPTYRAKNRKKQARVA
jgi:hypothetical protein